jgi:putative flippase GtrA
MIKKELKVFIIVGLITALVDYLVYQGLIASEYISLDLSKAFGFIVGTTFAYFSNKYWTFSYKEKKSNDVWKFLLLYSFTLLTNVKVNAYFVGLLSDVTNYSITAGFLIATTASASLNFIGMKFFVFTEASTKTLR